MAASGMVSVIVSGRLAWIGAMVLGLVFILAGALMHPPLVPLIVAGVLFFLFGLIFLILSFLTHGATD